MQLIIPANGNAYGSIQGKNDIRRAATFRF
jgi:hypothetical protein